MNKRINNNLKSIIYILPGLIIFSLMSTFVKLSSSNLNPLNHIFKIILSILILIPFIFLKLKVNLIIFASFNQSSNRYVCYVLNFYAISKLPLTNFAIISFSKIFL